MPVTAPAPAAPPPPSPPKPSPPSTPPSNVPRGTKEPSAPSPEKKDIASDLRSSLAEAFSPAEPKSEPEPKNEPAKENAEAELEPAELPATPPTPKEAKAIQEEKSLGALRRRAEAAEKELKRTKAELSKRTIPDDYEPLKEKAKRVEDLEKRYEQVAKDLKYAKYEKSPEYQDKFKKPLESAWADAYREIQDLTRPDADGNERQATKEDFHSLMQRPKKEAAELADQWFGPHMGREIMQHRRTVEDLHRKAAEATQNYEKEAGEIEAKGVADRTAQKEAIEKLWKISNDKVVQDFPEMFQPKEGDEEGNARLEGGYKFVDEILGAVARQHPSSRTEKGIADFALVRHLAASSARREHQLKTAREEIAALKVRVAEYEKTGAGEGAAGGRTAKDNGETPEQHSRNLRSDLKAIFSGKKTV